MTFSIVGYDPATGDLGIAVASKFLAVGAVVPWARGGVGAVATQAWANTTYGPTGLDLLAAGASADDVVRILTQNDPGAASRQVGIMDARGRAATFTGPECNTWAGGTTGEHCAAQGNILTGKATVVALAETFQRERGPLWRRLLAALAAGQAAGGDSRGQQSAALLVVRSGGGYGGFNDRLMDLRVDDAPRPIEDLARLMAMHELYFLKPAPEDFVPIDAALAAELQRLLAHSGDYDGSPSGQYDAATFAALEKYAGRENLEERLLHEPDDARLDRLVLAYLREHAAE